MSLTRAALERFLDRLQSRSDLSAEQRNAILSLDGKVTRVSGRSDVVSPGQTVDRACLVAEGLIARFDQMRSGQRQIVAFHIPGDMCDLHSLVAPTAGWGIASLRGSTFIEISHRSLRQLAETHNGIAFAFWRDTTADGSIFAKWVGNLGRQDARARLSHVLCEMGIRFERAGLGTRTLFEFPVTQEQLADALGLTAVHVNRTLQRLRGDRVIATRNHMIEVLDLDRLIQIAEFDPGYLLLGQRKAAAADAGAARVRESAR